MERALNEIEYFNWCVGQPYNMVLVVQLRGELTADQLRAALDKAQRRHPLLTVNTQPGPDGLPWFSSVGVAPIPLAVVEEAEPEAAQRLAERELTATFDRDQPGASRLPLMRVAWLRPRDPARPAALVFTAQHVIADGLSMLYLVRDLLHFIDEPDAAVEVLDAPARADDLFPPRLRRRIPTTPRRFHLALALARIYVRLRFGSRPPPPRQPTQRHRSWELSPDQTARLRARCRHEQVSVQAAICTALLPAFGFVHTPVNLRPFLARPLGESVGLFVGSADVGMKVRPGRGFWENARRFHRRLQRSLADPFGIYRLFSKAVPAEAVAQLGPLLMKIMSSRQRPFAVTNLGELDGKGVRLASKSLQLESFFGAVTGIVDSSVLTVYTIRGSLHLHLLATEASASASEVRDDVERAVARLVEAIDEPLTAPATSRGYAPQPG
jgi:hypothetical protein